ncbi:UL16 tegument protein [Meleagrid alphaherpesvirus 1]|uniref:UL16 tegument protein n=1 Tax=Meleagrid herpesvirus 1 TaxID=37108 RepID=Q9DPR9_MEHV1|nr:tegument protein UL16 [Meleagrid alphaherpesvirus 1]AKQ48619.1 tegument protein UL16 [iBAC vector pMeHV1-C7]AKQ48691.1 tegument protein UL16 [iBAC vector pMeHV1-C9]AKQ48763.1 tegument protein UL16 [iBAC vector pMeHV1-C10]AKQ48835.1 tegument protein UL16 [iBAC vector pMeHV1-C17]AKQ48908.1 tegument protein UL16 [iBAC vector pMeHV1-C18]
MDKARRPSDTCDQGFETFCGDMAVNFVNTLNDRACVWRTLRADSRLAVMSTVLALDRSFCMHAPPNTQEHKTKWVEIFMYLTRPKSLCLCRKAFYILFVINGVRLYSITSTLHIVPLRHKEGSADIIHFSGVSPADLPLVLPDVANEPLPPPPAMVPDIDALAERDRPPEDPDVCITVSIGAWWSISQRKFYYLRMEESLLAICPAGWQQRSLGATLAKFLDHENGCRQCNSHDSSHLDVYGGSWGCGTVGHACLCKGPCMWMKARQTELPVEGDTSLYCVLFMGMVKSVKLMIAENSKITDRLEDIIVAGGACCNTPVNSCGWHLVSLPTNWSMLMIQGCIKLPRLCYIS